MDHYADQLAQPHRDSQAKNKGNGKPLSFYLLLPVAGKMLQSRRIIGVIATKSQRTVDSVEIRNGLKCTS
jgi:hypothetical protein